jgi:hypothetical protein
MVIDNEFDYFLRNGIIEGLKHTDSLESIINRYGDDNWIAKEIENNGLIYGVFMLDMVEVHIYNEKVSGISFRPYAFDKAYYGKSKYPWIAEKMEILEIISELKIRKIKFERYCIHVDQPTKNFKTKGANLKLEQGEHTFIDTEGGVTFLFDSDNDAYQICKYYI